MVLYFPAIVSFVLLHFEVLQILLFLLRACGNWQVHGVHSVNRHNLSFIVYECRRFLHFCMHLYTQQKTQANLLQIEDFPDSLLDTSVEAGDTIFT